MEWGTLYPTTPSTQPYSSLQRETIPDESTFFLYILVLGAAVLATLALNAARWQIPMKTIVFISIGFVSVMLLAAMLVAGQSLAHIEVW